MLLILTIMVLINSCSSSHVDHSLVLAKGTMQLHINKNNFRVGRKASRWYFELYSHSIQSLAKVIALYKKGPKYDTGNYRPISLLSYFDKIFEKLICKRLISFLDMHKIMYCHQFGFRNRHSTVLALIDFTDSIGRLLDERNYALSL